MTSVAAVPRFGGRMLAGILLVSFAGTGLPALSPASGCRSGGGLLRPVAVATATSTSGAACDCLIACGSISCPVSSAPALKPVGTQAVVPHTSSSVGGVRVGRVANGPETGPPAPPPKQLILLA